MCDQGSKGWDQGSKAWYLGPQPWVQGSQTMGLGSAGFIRDQDQAVPYLWDQGRKLVTLLESRIRKFCTKMGPAMKNVLCYHPDK